MRHWTVVAMILVALAVTGGGANAQDPAELQRTLERILAGEGEAKGEAACDVLRSGVLTGVFGDAAEAAELRPGSKYVPHYLCTASWNKPNHEELEAAFVKYEMDKMVAKMKKEEFDRPKPPAASYSVSLTVNDEEYASPPAAVKSLESAVETLSEGLSVEVYGKEHEVQMEFGEWVDEVGDRAIWTAKGNELLVAHAGVRYAVSVNGFDDPAENQAKAIELAQEVAAGID
jgi:hypothetical protein